jgi:phosphoglucomutase
MEDAAIEAQYDRWLKLAEYCPYEELAALKDDDAARIDAFFTDLKFGTGGMRGIIGVGPNRMNVYTVARATQGLADFLKARVESPSVVIARDSRINGEQLVRAAASVLAANGIKVQLFLRIEPTPVLSFAVRELGCSAGICITAGHNPAEYNGYKVYGADGCQIAAQTANEIEQVISGIDIFDDVQRADFFDAVADGSISWVSEQLLDSYLDAVAASSIEELKANSDVPLSVVYTPLNGTGIECFRRISSLIGVDEVRIVPEQADPDGHFPTCSDPDPAAATALERGLNICHRTSPDLLIATDPSADRISVAAPRSGGFFQQVSGNELGVLLLDYLCRMRIARGESLKDKVVVTTIVSSAMADALAKRYGFELRRTLAGFKYVGEQIGNLESQDQVDRFIFGFEESCGYLAGSYVRDNDAIGIGMLVCQMFRHYKAMGKNVIDALEDLYGAFGYFRSKSVSVAYPGAAGAQRMQQIMRDLRKQVPAQIAGRAVQGVVDYATCQPMPTLNAQAGEPVQELPAEDMLELQLEGGAKVIVRPSGTEPAIKAYLFAKAREKKDANILMFELEAAAKELLG